VPVEVNVREIRRRLLAEGVELAGADGQSAASAGLCSLFQDVVAGFFSPGSPLYVTAVLEDVPVGAATWQAALVDAVYRGLVGPTLERQRATLTQLPEQVASFWEATLRLCDWLAGLLLAVHRKHGSLDAARDLIDCERQLRTELRDPCWADSVILAGPADVVLRGNDATDWCVVMLRTDGTAAEAGLALAALYKLLLATPETAAGEPRIVLFTPDMEEQRVAAGTLEATQSRLKKAIGRIAGLDLPTAAVPPVASPPKKWSRLMPEHLKMQQDLLRVLADYGLDTTIEGPPLLGPTFIRFLVRPASGAKVAHFTGLIDEIALGMSLRSPPMIERFGGQIAIDVERPDRHAVGFDELRPLLPPTDPLLGNSRLLVGVDLEGRPVFIDLAKPEHCHVLVVGTAGSGKSIWLRAAIASLVETNSPATLQLVLIDPKRNAFTAWRDSEYLREPIIFPDELSPVAVLHGLIEEMEARYKRMADADVDDLCDLVRREGRTTPRIVCVCDEYADLIEHSDDRKQVEAAIARLGAKARAAGIHLILATQTPRRDIVSGTIKANLPACVGLRVSSSAEARIIETPGADLLLGHGDLILKTIGEPQRLQGVFLPATGGRELSVPVAGAAE
jgi:S-DNA-T family DNA segregation ATPase FtsK/SpoIIIE